MATAYTRRYGNSNAGSGPGACCEVGVPSDSDGAFGDGAAMLVAGEGALMGGGSIADGAFVGTAGSGSGVISPSADDVSSVICFGGAVGTVPRML